ncbi:hypothetical protein OIU78_028317 [Salix suchowensis]|nr:hypothetical protein OIU78_028317 [Salix suchowensis]
MDTENSTFETTEMLADFLASTPLLSESWRLCNLANLKLAAGFRSQHRSEVLGMWPFLAPYLYLGQTPASRIWFVCRFVMVPVITFLFHYMTKMKGKSLSWCKVPC